MFTINTNYDPQVYSHKKLGKAKRTEIILKDVYCWMQQSHRGEMMTYVSLCQGNVSEEGLAVFLSHPPQCS